MDDNLLEKIGSFIEPENKFLSDLRKNILKLPFKLTNNHDFEEREHDLLDKEKKIKTAILVEKVLK